MTDNVSVDINNQHYMRSVVKESLETEPDPAIVSIHQKYLGTEQQPTQMMEKIDLADLPTESLKVFNPLPGELLATLREQMKATASESSLQAGFDKIFEALESGRTLEAQYFSERTLAMEGASEYMGGLIHSLRADILLKLRLFREAIDAADRALEQTPTFFVALFCRFASRYLLWNQEGGNSILISESMNDLRLAIKCAVEQGQEKASQDYTCLFRMLFPSHQ